MFAFSLRSTVPSTRSKGAVSAMYLQRFAARTTIYSVTNDLSVVRPKLHAPGTRHDSVDSESCHYVYSFARLRFLFGAMSFQDHFRFCAAHANSLVQRSRIDFDIDATIVLRVNWGLQRK